jgi:hypothetical protein
LKVERNKKIIGQINEFWFFSGDVEILKNFLSSFYQVPLFLVIICFFVQLGQVKFLGKVIMTAHMTLFDNF